MNRVLAAIQKAGTLIQMRGSAKAAILMYHRIASPEIDPWGLSVTPQHFEEHLAVICEQAQPLGLQQLAAAQREGNIPDRAVAITFDDGYSDNLYQAKPLLKKYNVPATVFVTTGHLDSQREFWWDELERVLLNPGTLPETLSLKIGGELRQWHLGAAAHYQPDDYDGDRYRKAWEGQSHSRLAFYYSVWSALRTLPTEQRQLLQDDILCWANAHPQAREEYRSLTTQELLSLEEGGLIEVGAHTVTHPSLPAHPREVQRQEVCTSKERLEQILKHSIKSFAYPFGDFSKASVSVVKECGFEYACSTVQLGVWQGSDCFQLPRYEVVNHSGKELSKQLSKWLPP
jgi:peptidoglycan/xylan/chitin deacetylase (PgdA/CDA1 family)